MVEVKCPACLKPFKSGVEALKAHIIGKFSTCLRSPTIFESDLLSKDMKAEFTEWIEWYRQEEASKSIRGTEHSEQPEGGSTGSIPREEASGGDFQRGFHEGFEEGRRAGQVEGQKEGFQEGFESGFATGLSTAAREAETTSRYDAGAAPSAMGSSEYRAGKRQRH